MARRWRNTSSLHTNVAVVSSVFFQAKHAVVIAFGCSVLVPIKWANVNGSLFTSSECHWHTAKDILYCVRRFAPLLMWPSLEWPFAVGVEKKKRNSPFLPFLSCINTMEVHGCCRQQITYLQEQRNKREFQGELNSRQPMGYSCSIGQIKLKAIPFLCNNRPVLVKPPPPLRPPESDGYLRCARAYRHLYLFFWVHFNNEYVCPEVTRVYVDMVCPVSSFFLCFAGKCKCTLHTIQAFHDCRPAKTPQCVKMTL